MLIRELDANKQFIKSIILKNGDSYEPSSDAALLAIGIYNAKSEYGLTYESYKLLFENGFKVKLVPNGVEVEETATPDTSTDTPKPTVTPTVEKEETQTTSTPIINNDTVEENDTSDSVESCDFSDISSWRSGVYYYTNGVYQEDEKKVVSYRI